mmetsp:Transcript_30673/g.67383  ORF Transcript_30673/g.67383 Transcript_30673/m.67383 type:complete len:84 (+) Transcript_30673:2029-2280(+)
MLPTKEDCWTSVLPGPDLLLVASLAGENCMNASDVIESNRKMQHHDDASTTYFEKSVMWRVPVMAEGTVMSRPPSVAVRGYSS